MLMFWYVYRLGPAVLDLLADIVLQELSPVTRRKWEHLIAELVQQRDVTRSLIHQRMLDTKGFTWLYQMRFYLDRAVENPLERLLIKVADTSTWSGRI